MGGSNEQFAGRVLAMATMHGKEKVIGPSLVQALGLVGFEVIPDLDTDRFGSFSGEVERTMDPLAACIAKAKYGAELSGVDLIIASEGSFGPYPPAPFVPCDEEHLVLLDRRTNELFTHRHVSLRTIFGGGSFRTVAAVHEFAGRMQFPSHALVVRPTERWKVGQPVHKGIVSPSVLDRTVKELIDGYGEVWVETDMRAMVNPTRMEVIKEAAQGFANELSATCPACGTFWFRITGVRTGLPCSLCGSPTESIVAFERSCRDCVHKTFEPRPDGRTSEEPTHCGRCNP